MTGLNPRAAAPTRRGRTPQAVPAPRRTLFGHLAKSEHSSRGRTRSTGHLRAAHLRAGRTNHARTGEHCQELDRRITTTEKCSEPLLLTVAQAAQRLGISRSLLYELLATGDIESITIGRLRRIPADALTTYIQIQRTKNQGPRTRPRTTIHPEPR